MDRDRDQLRQEIEETKASMAAKLEAIGERFEGARSRLEHVRERISIRHQVEQRPWTLMGLSVLTGYILYRVTHTRRAEETVEAVGERARSVTEPALSAVRVAADKARAGAGRVRERLSERDQSFVRTAAGAMTRALLANLGRTLAGVIASRIKSSVEEGRLLGSGSPQAGASGHTMDIRAPEAATGTVYPPHPGMTGTGR